MADPRAAFGQLVGADLHLESVLIVCPFAARLIRA
jgi:hypothetical protein